MNLCVVLLLAAVGIMPTTARIQLFFAHSPQLHQQYGVPQTFYWVPSEIEFFQQPPDYAVNDPALAVNNEVYFDGFPHLRALFKNQKLRLDNELAPHKLGSLRVTSPYLRY